MRPIIIHIGPHKTGSTSIQRSLDTNIDRLRALGFELPHLNTTFKHPSESHRLLVTPVNRVKVASDQVWQKLLAEASASPHTYVISTELLSLHFLQKRKLDALVAELTRAGFRATFIYYAREQISWINSTYVQETKRTYTSKTFPEYVTEALANPRFDHMKMTAAFLGRNDLDIRIVYFAQAVRTGLLRSCLFHMGISETDIESFSEAKKQNPNAGTKAVFMGRELARFKDSLGLKPTDKRIAPDFKRIYGKLKWDREPYSGFDDALAETVRAAFAESNQNFAQAFGLPPWHEVHPPGSVIRREFVPEERSVLENWEIRLVRTRLQALLRKRAASRAD